MFGKRREQKIKKKHERLMHNLSEYRVASAKKFLLETIKTPSEVLESMSDTELVAVANETEKRYFGALEEKKIAELDHKVSTVIARSAGWPGSAIQQETEIYFDRLRIFWEIQNYAENYLRNESKFTVIPMVHYTHEPNRNYLYKRFLVQISAIDDAASNFDLEVAFSRSLDSGDADIGEIKHHRDLVEATAYAQIVAAYLTVNISIPQKVTEDSHELKLSDIPSVKIQIPLDLREQKFYESSFVDGETKF